MNLRLLVPFLALLPSLFCTAIRSAAQTDDRPIVNDTGAAPARAAANGLPTLWIAGDSTVNSGSPLRGWGQDLGRFFNPAKINVVNRAIGGRSSRTFYTEGRWQKILDALKPGDWVIVQFGHNDVGRPDASSKFRGSLKGVGDETEQVAKPDGTTEVVHTYGWYIKDFASTARAKGAHVVLCSPIPHKRFDSSGKFIHDWADMRGWVAASAKTTGADYVDLAEIIARAYDQLPQARVEALFADKGTHTNAAGALLNARCVVLGLKSLPGNPLGSDFSADGKAVH